MKSKFSQDQIFFTESSSSMVFFFSLLCLLTRELSHPRFDELLVGVDGVVLKFGLV